MSAHWCKVASNLDTHPKIRKAGRLGREIFLFALRRNAEPGNRIPGRISAEELDPDYLCDMLFVTRDEAVTGVTLAVTAGLLARDGDEFVIVAWKDGWGKGSSAGAERTAKWRENRKLKNGSVTRDMRDVTRDSGDACDTDKIRSDKSIEGGVSPGLAALVAKVDAATGDIGKARARKKPEPHPDRARVIDAFHQAFKSAYGTKPTWGSKSVAQVESLLKKHPAGILIERIAFMFSGRAKWPPGPYSLEVFVGHIDRWVESNAQSSQPFRRVDEL